MTLRKKLISILLFVFLASTLMGCEIFEKKKVEITEVQAQAFGDLEEGFYIKTGDSFYATYSNGFTFSASTPTSINNERIFWIKGKEKLMPVLYNDSYLIYKSDSDVTRSFTFEKYQDAGYTIGIKCIDIGVDFYSCNVASSNVYEGSDAAKALSKEIDDGKTVMFETLNESKITERNISECRTFVGLEEGKKYLLGCYVGTEYKEYTVLADIHVYYAVDILKTNEFLYTHNGYTIIPIPKDMESGYYSVNGSGMFYYAKDKKSESKYFPETNNKAPSIKIYEEPTTNAESETQTKEKAEETSKVENATIEKATIQD